MFFKKLFSAVIITALVLVSLSSVAQRKAAKAVPPPLTERETWLNQLDKLARPVLYNLANDSLKIVMPVALSKRIDDPVNRTKAAYLEAFARTLSGIGPWLNLEGGSPKEIELRRQYRDWTLKSAHNAVDPAAKDYMEWKTGGQPLVDASFMAFGFLRCPWLWQNLNEVTRQQVIDVLNIARTIKPGFSNWLLFSGMIEAFFCRYDMPWDEMRVDYCLRQLDQWYVGDGMYSDGPDFHFDYYNSYVIHPYLATILEVVKQKTKSYNWLFDKSKIRNERYAQIQERLINADGSFPATGRSIIYRGGAFHHLADMALRKKLPASLKPAQVRGALTAVIKKTMEAPAAYNDKGWLNIGLYGSQPDIADTYNNTGSLYLCAVILLPLGLPETDEFWSSPPLKWTAQKIWNGEDAPNDHAVD